MWVTYTDRSRGRTALWADGYFTASRGPPPVGRIREALVEAPRPATESGGGGSDVACFVCQVGVYDGPLPEPRLLYELRRLDAPEYRQIILTCPIELASQVRRNFRRTLREMSFQNVRGYYIRPDRFKEEVTDFLIGLTHSNHDNLDVTSDYVMKANLVLLRAE